MFTEETAFPVVQKCFKTRENSSIFSLGSKSETAGNCWGKKNKTMVFQRREVEMIDFNRLCRMNVQTVGECESSGFKDPRT